MVFDPFAIFREIVPVWEQLWWSVPLIVFVLLAIKGAAVWRLYVQEVQKAGNPPVILEIKIPAQLRRWPQAMEQVFFALHAFRNSASSFKEKWWDGEFTWWYSFEIISVGGDIYFYVWLPQNRRNAFEAALYAQYPDINITQVEDYVSLLPQTYEQLSRQNYELFGNELILEKADVYPIRTYTAFESPEEEKSLDPMAALIEALARAKAGEHIWIQVVIRPMTNDSWKKRGEQEIRKLKKEWTAASVIKTEESKSVMTERTPGETEVIKAIERNIEKPGFETIVRYIYIAPKEVFDSGGIRRSILAAFNQYASERLNRFKNNTSSWTLVDPWSWPFIFAKKRERARKELMYKKYRQRYIRPETFWTRLAESGISGINAKWYVLNTEELATIYHYPTHLVVTAPFVRSIGARSVGPPAGIAIYSEEEK